MYNQGKWQAAGKKEIRPLFLHGSAGERFRAEAIHARKKLVGERMMVGLGAEGRSVGRRELRRRKED